MNMIDYHYEFVYISPYYARHIFFVPTVSLHSPYSYLYTGHLCALYYLIGCTFLKLRLYLVTGVRKNIKKKNEVSFAVSSLQQTDVGTEPLLAEGKNSHHCHCDRRGSIVILLRSVLLPLMTARPFPHLLLPSKTQCECLVLPMHRAGVCICPASRSKSQHWSWSSQIIQYLFLVYL